MYEHVAAEANSLFDEQRFRVNYDKAFVSGAFMTVLASMLLEAEETLNKQSADSIGKQSLANPAEQVKEMSRYAMEYFQRHVTAKMQTALIELMGEAVWYAPKAWIERDGADEEAIKKSSPSLAILQQTILRPSIEKFKQHPLLEEPTENDESNKAEHPVARVGQKVFEGQVMYAYDVEGVREIFQEYFRPYLSKREDAEYWIDQHAREAGEFIWEHIDGAVQTVLAILSSYAGTLAQQSLARRHKMKPKEVKLRLPGKQAMKELSKNIFTLWFDNLPAEFRESGRPRKRPDEQASQHERDEFLQKARKARAELRIVDKGNVGLKLGYGRTKESAQRMLYRKMKKYEVTWDEIK